MSAPPADIPATEAATVPPWSPGQPKPDVHIYPPRDRPALWVYVAGQWRHVLVRARHTTRQHVTYQVDLDIPDGPHRGRYIRTYRWGDPAVRAAREQQ